MKVLKTAIYTKITGTPSNTFYVAIGGRFYFENAPQDTVFPYCTYHIITNTYEYQFVEDFQNVIVQFSIFSNKSSSSEVDDAFEYLKTLFDWSKFTITGYSIVSNTRIFDTIDYFPEDNVWQIVVQYRILLIKT